MSKDSKERGKSSERKGSGTLHRNVKDRAPERYNQGPRIEERSRDRKRESVSDTLKPVPPTKKGGTSGDGTGS
ncbi:MAG: hypothetical protein OXF23_05130 [Candidatus Dadabacteria bacterium]|nr:hypothetical protein [Candidatus Dadabacteria bacterium]